MKLVILMKRKLWCSRSDLVLQYIYIYYIIFRISLIFAVLDVPMEAWRSLAGNRKYWGELTTAVSC